MPRKALWSFGSHGRSVRVYVETFKDAGRQALVRVAWREDGKRRTESLPDSGKNRQRAKAFAEGVAERLTLHGPVKSDVRTLHQLGDAYRLAHPTPETWRETTRRTFDVRFRVLETILTPDRNLDTITPDTVDRLRERMRNGGHAVNQIANHVQLLKSLLKFAKMRRYIAENLIAEYEMKLSRDQRRRQVPEWTAEECAKILAALSPKSSRHWRPYVAILIDAQLGGRSTALLNLEWRDVDMTARTIRWRPELDKLAKDRTQPLPRDVVRALRIAKVWRARIGYQGPYIVPGATAASRGLVKAVPEWAKDPKHKRVGTGRGTPRVVADRPYSYGALHHALKQAAERAGVAWVDWRAMHGFRRHVVNNVLTLTGNLTRAGQWVGDVDMRTLMESYVRERPEELRDVAAALPAPEANPKAERPEQQNDNGQPVKAGRKGVNP